MSGERPPPAPSPPDPFTPAYQSISSATAEIQPAEHVTARSGCLPPTPVTATALFCAVVLGVLPSGKCSACQNALRAVVEQTSIDGNGCDEERNQPVSGAQAAEFANTPKVSRNARRTLSRIHWPTLFLRACVTVFALPCNDKHRLQSAM